jgi:hypothetical protein
MVEPITAQNILIKAIRNPLDMIDFSALEWNTCIKEAKLSALSGRLAYDAKQLKFDHKLPLKVQNIFKSFINESRSSQRRVTWEINRVKRALYDCDEKVVLLKGAAYLVKKLRCSHGRMSVDLDILVAKNRLDWVEEKFLSAGWESQVVNDYDQKFYREYSHELPPMVHPDRNISIDVHHTILPITNKMCPDINKMLDKIVKSQDGFYTFSNIDIILHSVVHLFQDGEIRSSLRNLVEQHDLYTEFGEDSHFWQNLIPRAEELGLLRPLYYSLIFCRMIMGTVIPDHVMTGMNNHKPHFIYDNLMKLMVPNVISPSLGARGLKRWLCQNGLYIRSHWLRMPPLLLAKHLTIKFFRGFKTEP